MNTAAYITTDVFTSERFAGNPLAVIPDARGLSDKAMQKIATEFNYSEVTFVLPPENPENTARVRIFTPTKEIPFAGHPNVGTAFVLGQQTEIFGKIPGDRLIFEEKAGLVGVELLRNE
ncbi:MAG: PhzF family phenazine biosynthesis protein, partial [Rhizobiaceae bacterium]|nr:PhzF family phenazine biosynthesis protein [Rhizobiaceae bacterium]